MNTRKLLEVIDAREAQDGAGVNLYRVFGGQPQRFDPFLMLDEFGSDNPDDYIAGFPPHPHRGFRTVTYMLKGSFEHRDHMGNVGAINDGGVQWMTAGKGVIHSEMPIQTEGQARGFQLWLNLPARDKLCPPSYENIQADGIAKIRVGELSVKSIAGEGVLNGEPVASHMQVADTEPRYWDISGDVDKPADIRIPIEDGHTALLYVVDGELSVDGQLARPRQLLRFSDQGELSFSLKGRALLLSGKPLRESVVQYGPFVMNTREEIEQAIRDYQAGKLV